LKNETEFDWKNTCFYVKTMLRKTFLTSPRNYTGCFRNSFADTDCIAWLYVSKEVTFSSSKIAFKQYFLNFKESNFKLTNKLHITHGTQRGSEYEHIRYYFTILLIKTAWYLRITILNITYLRRKCFPINIAEKNDWK